MSKGFWKIEACLKRFCCCGLKKASSIADFPGSSYLGRKFDEKSEVRKYNQAMGSSEKLCLQWNDFQANLNSAFKELRRDTELSDVTLVSDDGKQVEAHKVILASSSPFFANLLKRNKHPHPLIFMRGVTEEVLVATVDFLYNGEGNIYQENLDPFLALAQDLRLKGLTGDFTEGNTSQGPSHVKSPSGEEEKTFFPKELKNSRKIARLQRWEDEASSEMSVSTINNQSVSVELHQLDDQIKSMMEHTGKSIMVGNTKREAMLCKVCGKEGQLGNITNHIESNHITGVTHSCDICNKTSRSRNALYQHTKMEHHA